MYKNGDLSFRVEALRAFGKAPLYNEFALVSLYEYSAILLKESLLKSNTEHLLEKVETNFEKIYTRLSENWKFTSANQFFDETTVYNLLQSVKFAHGFIHWKNKNYQKARHHFRNYKSFYNKLLMKLWFDLEFTWWETQIKNEYGERPNSLKSLISKDLKNCIKLVWGEIDLKESVGREMNFNPNAVVALASIAKQEEQDDLAEEYTKILQKQVEYSIFSSIYPTVNVENVKKFICAMTKCKDKKAEPIPIQNDTKIVEEPKPDQLLADKNKVKVFFEINKMKDSSNTVLDTLDDIKLQNAELIRKKSLEYLDELLSRL